MCPAPSSHATARILHTADWQLGMTRHFLSDEDQGRFAQARIDVVRALARLAGAEGCAAMVVCGDVFESSQVDRRTILRALDALAGSPVPVFLLPGNHDPLDAGSVYRARAFLEHRPPGVHVLDDARPVTVRPGLELVGAPWTSKRPLRDLVAETTAALAPAPPGVLRVCLAHAGVAALGGKQDDAAALDVPAAERALADGRIHYLALGDRHSTTAVGATGRIWYAGAPEPTDYDERDAGNALVVELSPEGARVTPHRVGTWRFIERERVDVAGEDDLGALEAWLATLEAKERTIVKLRLHGALPLRLRARLETALELARQRLAGLELRDAQLATVPDDADFADLQLAGFARAAADGLRAAARGAGDLATTAQDALALLVRLTGRAA
jgi:DNA repair exonuclease SbcCD nuclease subunit